MNLGNPCSGCEARKEQEKKALVAQWQGEGSGRLGRVRWQGCVGEMLGSFLEAARELQLEHCAEGKTRWVVLSTSPSVPEPELGTGPRTASNAQCELLVRQE